MPPSVPNIGSNTFTKQAHAFLLLFFLKKSPATSFGVSPTHRSRGRVFCPEGWKPLRWSAGCLPEAERRQEPCTPAVLADQAGGPVRRLETRNPMLLFSLVGLSLLRIEDP